MNLFLRHKFSDFDSMVMRIAALILNESVGDSAGLIDRSGYAPMVVEHIVDLLENNGLLRVSKHYGGFFVYNPSPSLKRMLR
jgi:hypothetical protein